MEKRKIVAAAVSLILCFAVLISSSYAWFSISRAPEISGIATNIGSNGSLEIALVSDETFMDPSLIKNGVGDSAAAQEKTVSNLRWGNVIDLSDESYGLDKISLLPSKLAIIAGEDGSQTIGSNILGFMDYSSDGRVERQNMESVSAVYSEDGFIFRSELQSHGVRGIGTIPDVVPQQIALSSARALVASYRSSAIAETKAAFEENGDNIIDIFRRVYLLGNNYFDADDIKAVRDTAVRMRRAYDYIDSALRQGIIGYASSIIDDEELFIELRSAVENTSIPLSMLVSSLPNELPSGFSSWVTNSDSVRYDLTLVITACDKLPGRCTWNEMSKIIEIMIDPSVAMIQGYKINSFFNSRDLLPGDTLTLSPNSGAFAGIADFCGNFSILFTYEENKTLNARSVSSKKDSHLVWIQNELDKYEPAGNEAGPTFAEINDIYGYAIDLALRCNQESTLLLQTEAVERYGEKTENGQNMGGGSYMSFSSEQLTEEQILPLVDAIRIGFVDSQGNLSAVAKLGTSNYKFEENVLSAPIWLYKYELSESGSIIMGERRKEDADIMALIGDTPVLLSVIVWLDGDYIYNSSAAISGQSMTGTLNLQFSSSAELNPADVFVNSTGE